MDDDRVAGLDRPHRRTDLFDPAGVLMTERVGELEVGNVDLRIPSMMWRSVRQSPALRCAR